jgi:drug/metabolite transporter (DMT)-like permease
VIAFIGSFRLPWCFEQDFVATMGLCLSAQRHALSARLHVVRARRARHARSIVRRQILIVYHSLTGSIVLTRSIPFFAFVPAYEIHLDTVVRVLPLTVAFIAMLATGNLCLHYVEVSFYQVARSLTICFSIALSYFVLGVKTSPRAIAACVVVMVGFAIGAKASHSFQSSVSCLAW